MNHVKKINTLVAYVEKVNSEKEEFDKQIQERIKTIQDKDYEIGILNKQKEGLDSQLEAEHSSNLYLGKGLRTNLRKAGLQSNHWENNQLLYIR
jgi:aromatic ring-opening dioxygenase catalytic subunit (LigB family)